MYFCKIMNRNCVGKNAIVQIILYVFLVLFISPVDLYAADPKTLDEAVELVNIKVNELRNKNASKREINKKIAEFVSNLVGNRISNANDSEGVWKIGLFSSAIHSLTGHKTDGFKLDEKYVRERKKIPGSLPGRGYEARAKWAWKLRYGTCSEAAAISYCILKKAGFKNLKIMWNPTHEWVVMGMDKKANVADPRTWGKNAFSVDGWQETWFNSQEAYNNKYIGYFGRLKWKDPKTGRILKITDTTLRDDNPAVYQKYLEEKKRQKQKLIRLSVTSSGEVDAGGTAVFQALADFEVINPPSPPTRQLGVPVTTQATWSFTAGTQTAPGKVKVGCELEGKSVTATATFRGETGSAPVSVKKLPLDGLTIKAGAGQAKPGEAVSLSVTATYKNANCPAIERPNPPGIRWMASGGGTASSAGLLIDVDKEDGVITVIAKLGSVTSNTVKIKVIPPTLESIEIVAPGSVDPCQTIVLKALGRYSNKPDRLQPIKDKSITWEFSGRHTRLSQNSVRADWPGDTISATATVAGVPPAKTSVVVNPLPDTSPWFPLEDVSIATRVKVGETIVNNAYEFYCQGSKHATKRATNVQWLSETPRLLSCDSGGTCTGIEVGQAIVTLMYKGGKITSRYVSVYEDDPTKDSLYASAQNLWEAKQFDRSGQQQIDYGKKPDQFGSDLRKKLKDMQTTLVESKKQKHKGSSTESSKKTKPGVKVPPKKDFKCKSNQECWDHHGACNYYCKKATAECIQCQKKKEHGGTEGCIPGEKVWPNCGPPKVSTPEAPAYYLVKLDMYLRINETPCKLTFYSCTECTEEDLKLFMSFARKQYQKALGPIGPGGVEDDQCVMTQELVDFKVTVVQGPSKTPIMVPRPSTNCPCRDTPVFQYQLKSEYQPDCVSYEEFKKAKQLLQK